jgi:hypothetical protein
VKALLYLALGLPLLAGDAKNDFFPDADFLRYKTFSFVPIGGTHLTGVMADPDNRERIKNFISGALSTRGLHEVPRDAPHDLDIRYWLALEHREEEEAIDYYSDWWGGYPPYWTGPWAWSYTEYVVKHWVDGTLLVDLLDPRDKQLIWRTFLRQKIEDRGEAYDKAKKTLYKAFEGYPPSEKDKTKMRKKASKSAAD